jgi:hypothetical protein
MGISTNKLISETIQLKSSDIYRTKNIDGLILHKLKKYEGKCTKNGYILKDGINIVNRTIGKIVNIDNNSLIEYKINYNIQSILPTIGSVYNCTINNISKMGLICYIEYGELNDIKSSPLLIIVPKEYCEIEKLKEGQKINVEAMDMRIKYMSNQIQVIGKFKD